MKRLQLWWWLAMLYPRYLRYRLGCWLLRPHALELAAYYDWRGQRRQRMGDHASAATCWAWCGATMNAVGLGVMGWHYPGRVADERDAAAVREEMYA